MPTTSEDGLYTANAADQAHPNQNDLAYGDTEIRELKSYIAGLPAVTNNARFPVRQTVLSGRQDMTQFGAPANFVEAGTGLNAIVRATAAAIVIAFAAGNTAQGAVDFGVTIPADVTIPLNTVANNFLYAQRDPSLGTITWGADYIPPQYSRTGGINQANLLHFDGNFNDSYGGVSTWVAGGGAVTSNAAFKFGTQSLLLNGTTQYIENPNIVQPSQQARWCKEFFFRLGSTSQLSQTLYGASGSGGYGITLRYNDTTADNKFALYLSSNGTAADIANAVKSTATYTDTTAFHHAAIEFDGSTYKLYIDGALQITITSSVLIGSMVRELLGANPASPVSTGTYFNGYIDEYRSSAKARYLGAFTPPTTAYTIDETWAVFDTINYRMSLMGAAPATVQRVYVGEAITNVNVVTSQLTYALQGRFSGKLGVQAPTTTMNWTDNLGVRTGSEIMDIKAINKIPEQGAQVGTAIFNPTTSNPSYGLPWAPNRISRNQTAVVLGPTSSLLLNIGSSFTAATPANWDALLHVTRGF